MRLLSSTKPYLWTAFWDGSDGDCIIENDSFLCANREYNFRNFIVCSWAKVRFEKQWVPTIKVRGMLINEWVIDMRGGEITWNCSITNANVGTISNSSYDWWPYCWGCWWPYSEVDNGCVSCPWCPWCPWTSLCGGYGWAWAYCYDNWCAPDWYNWWNWWWWSSAYYRGGAGWGWGWGGGRFGNWWDWGRGGYETMPSPEPTWNGWYGWNGAPRWCWGDGASSDKTAPWNWWNGYEWGAGWYWYCVMWWNWWLGVVLGWAWWCWYRRDGGMGWNAVNNMFGLFISARKFVNCWTICSKWWDWWAGWPSYCHTWWKWWNWANGWCIAIIYWERFSNSGTIDVSGGKWGKWGKGTYWVDGANWVDWADGSCCIYHLVG